MFVFVSGTTSFTLLTKGSTQGGGGGRERRGGAVKGRDAFLFKGGNWGYCLHTLPTEDVFFKGAIQTNINL